MKKMKAFLDSILAVLEDESIGEHDIVFPSRKKLTDHMQSEPLAPYTFWDRGLEESPRWVARYTGEQK